MHSCFSQLPAITLQNNCVWKIRTDFQNHLKCPHQAFSVFRITRNPEAVFSLNNAPLAYVLPLVLDVGLYDEDKENQSGDQVVQKLGWQWAWGDIFCPVASMVCVLPSQLWYGAVPWVWHPIPSSYWWIDINTAEHLVEEKSGYAAMEIYVCGNLAPGDTGS